MDLLKYLESGGLLALLVLIIATGMRQVWVWGWMYRAAIIDRDEWKARSLRTLDLVEKAVDISRGGP